jgi:hypothetical protein
VFLGLIGVVYYAWSGETSGTVMLIFGCCAYGLLFGFIYLVYLRRHKLPRPEDCEEANLEDGEGVVGFFRGNSIWPVAMGLSAISLAIGLAFGKWFWAGAESPVDKHDVPHQHLAEVHDVEKRADADGIEGVLAARRDPLGVEVLLGHVAGEALDDRADEGHYASGPGQGPPSPPGGHPELAPQVDDHEGHEGFDAPEVEAIEEAPDGVRMPPVGIS